uniref:Integumentary mucin C.1-like n=1 Tax=Magallana gigas TaxID=29159 RepID=A0A8W8P0F1_MAGGI|nr:salivary glue protein Sgs-3-like [Crassostrea gigas]
MLLRRFVQQDVTRLTCWLLTVYLLQNYCLGEETCYVCRHERDFTSCAQNKTVCPHGEVCFTSESFHGHGIVEYSSGCISEQICNTIKNIDGRTTHAPLQIGHIIGRKKRATDTCFHCCTAESTSYVPCNDHPCAATGVFTTMPTTTTTTPTTTTTTPTTTTTTPTTTTSTPTTTTPTTTTTTPTMTTPITTTTTPTTTTPTPTTTTPTTTTTTTPTMTTPITTTTTPTTTTTTSTTTTLVAKNSCNVCNGMPLYLCEIIYTPMTCEAGKQFCMNVLVNNKDGSRTVDRKCVAEEECKREWWYTTSDRQECTSYDPNYIFTLYFTCSYCCTGPLCNGNIVPDSSTLYRPH